MPVMPGKNGKNFSPKWPRKAIGKHAETRPLATTFIISVVCYLYSYTNLALSIRFMTDTAASGSVDKSVQVKLVLLGMALLLWLCLHMTTLHIICACGFRL